MSVGEGEGRLKGGEGASFLNPKVNRQSANVNDAPPPEAVLAPDVVQTPPLEDTQPKKNPFGDSQHGNQ